MAGGNEDHQESMEGTEDSDAFLTDQSDCDDIDLDAGDMEYYEENEYCAVHQNLKDDIRKALAAFPELEEDLGIPSVQIDETKTNLKYISSVVLSFTLKDISDHLLQLWDLQDTGYIMMELDNIHRSEFRTSGQLPTVTVRRQSSEDHFIVGEQLKNFALKVCRESFVLRSNESPNVVGSFFSLLYEKVQERLSRLTEYCVTCGEVLACGGVLPSICDRELCMYQYSELRLVSFFCNLSTKGSHQLTTTDCTSPEAQLYLFDGMNVPRVTPEVLSLLLFAFANANLSQRRKDILTPTPPIKSMVALLEEAMTKRAEKAGGAGDWKYGNEDMRGTAYWNYTVSNATAQKINHAFNSTEVSTFCVLLENLPCPNAFLSSVTAYHQFRKDWPVMSDIVDWLVISNRSYLEKVPKPMAVDFLHTDHQYCFISDTPAKQAEFDRLVASNGGKTRFFFHGSPLENWHSIIRSGLKNMSGTKFQLVGAAYGKGIYLSPFLDFAIGYASRLYHRGRGSDGKLTQDRPIRNDCKKGECCATEKMEDLSCVALVEVVDCPAAYNEKTEEIFVVEQEQWCSIRMLLLYRGSDINKLHSAVSKVSCGHFSRHPTGRAIASKARRMNLPVPPGGSSQSTAPHILPTVPSAPSTPATTGTVPNPFAQSQASSQPPTSSHQGIMSYMMNKISTWSGGPNGTPANGGAATASLQAGGSRELMAKLGEAKMAKRREQEKNGDNDLLRALKASRKHFGRPPKKAGDRTSNSPPTLGTTNGGGEVVDLTKEADDQPGTSGLQKEARKEREKRLRMALGGASSSQDDDSSDSDAEVDLNEGSLALEAKRRISLESEDDKEENPKKKASNKKKNESKKNPELDKMLDVADGSVLMSKRKRAMDDSSEVPAKSSTSPSNNKNNEDESGLNEEDLKILEMFGSSDIGGESDVQVVGSASGKKEGKTKSIPMKKKGDETDEVWVLSSDDEREEKELREAIRRSLASAEKNGEKEDEKGEQEGSHKTSASEIVLVDSDNEENKATSSKAPPPSIPPSRRIQVAYRSVPPMQPSSMTLSQSLSSSSTSYPTLAPPPPFPIAPSYQAIPAVPLNPPPGLPAGAHSSNLMQAHSFLQQHQAMMAAQAASMQQALQQFQAGSSSALNPPPIPGVPPSSVAGVHLPPGMPSSFFQMLTGGFARRRRAGRETGGERGPPIPGDLTEITEDQRNQIARVVHMFRNSCFEEKVNRHMNRGEDEKKEENDGDAGDNSNSDS